MISEHKIGVKTNSQISHGFDFLNETDNRLSNETDFQMKQITDIIFLE